MKKTLLLAIVVLLVSPLPASGRDRDPGDIRLIDAYESPREVARGGRTQGVLETAQQEINYFGGTTCASDSMRCEAIPDSMLTFDNGVGYNFN